MTESFDRFSRRHEDLVANFSHFGEVHCPQVEGWIYQMLCKGVKGDKTLLEIAARAPATQPPPNLLFAAVHYLLLGGERHPLRQWYPALADGDPRPPDSSFPPFRDFCLRHRDRLEGLIETRLTQTNVIQRCSALLPGFARVLEAAEQNALSLIEIGPSAGLNLQWDRFFYCYDDGTTWGDSNSRVRVPCEVRGETGLPRLPKKISVDWRRGIDLHPVDVTDPDEVLWLRALVWPDHEGRQEKLTRAIEIGQKYPPRIVCGDAAASLGKLIAKAPPESTLCIYGTHTLYQFPHEALLATLKSMQEASSARPIHFLSIEGTGSDYSELHWTIYENAQRSTRLLARCSSHGRWIEWLD